MTYRGMSEALPSVLHAQLSVFLPLTCMCIYFSPEARVLQVNTDLDQGLQIVCKKGGRKLYADPLGGFDNAAQRVDVDDPDYLQAALFSFVHHCP